MSGRLTDILLLDLASSESERLKWLCPVAEAKKAGDAGMDMLRTLKPTERILLLLLLL